MKKKILTKFLALMLACVVLLGTATTAFALEVSESVYQNVLLAKAVEQYQKYLETVNYEQIIILSNIFSVEQIEGYTKLLDEAKIAQLAAHAENLFSTYVELLPLPGLDWVDEPVESEYGYVPKDFTNVAPFGAPVTGGQ